MRIHRLELLLLGQLGDHVLRRRERVVMRGKLLDESRVPLEELGQLFGR